MNRFLLIAVAAAVTAFSGAAYGEQPAKKKLLVITESKGYVHDVVRRPKDGGMCLVEKTLTEMGAKSGLFEAVVSQDSRKDITAENLKNFDAVWFYTTGSLPISDVQKSDLLAFVRSGKGFGGCHSATDTFYDWPEYGDLIGAYFDGHPWHQKIPVVVENKTHAATKHLGDSFEITDEIYQFRTPYSRTKLNVLMRMEPKFGVEAREKDLARVEAEKAALLEKATKLDEDGKKDEAKKLRESAEGKRPNIRRTDGDWALAWTRDYGKGRVFYTALGHRDDVWRDARYQQHVLGGLKYLFFVDNEK